MDYSPVARYATNCRGSILLPGQAEEYLRILQPLNPEANHILVFDPPDRWSNSNPWVNLPGNLLLS